VVVSPSGFLVRLLAYLKVAIILVLVKTPREHTCRHCCEDDEPSNQAGGDVDPRLGGRVLDAGEEVDK